MYYGISQCTVGYCSALWDIAVLWDIALHYEISQCIMGYCIILWDIEVLYGISCCMMGYCGVLWDIAVYYGDALSVIVAHYGMHVISPKRFRQSAHMLRNGAY